MNSLKQTLRQSSIARSRFLKDIYWKMLGLFRQVGLVAPASPTEAGLVSYRRRSSWELDPKSCPCDLQLVEYLRQKNIGDQSIFHFGTGVHHLLGRENLTLAKPNQIFGITASHPEHEAYVKLVLQERGFDQYYKVLFCDIYALTARNLPNFDIITLFHLCEFYMPSQAPFVHHDDRSLLDLFLQKLNPNGRIIFYDRSNNWHDAKLLVQAAEARGDIEPIDTYQNLLIYRRKNS
jgi:hypothetical protein